MLRLQRARVSAVCVHWLFVEGPNSDVTICVAAVAVCRAVSGPLARDAWQYALTVRRNTWQADQPARSCLLTFSHAQVVTDVPLGEGLSLLQLCMSLILSM